MKAVASGHPGVMLFHGDCRDVLAELPDASIDAVVTDPPYELGFMGRAWDASGIAYSVGLWRECLRVLKPGGHLLAFGGARTYHRLTCAIEDAGFEIRDSITWLYGSGFPKSLDVSKALDKAAGAERAVIGVGRWAGRESSSDFGMMNDGAWQAGAARVLTAPTTDDAKRWQGWGTALKPAHEPIVVARKPLAGAVAANVLAHGTGAINVDACRVPSDENRGRPPRTPNEIYGGGHGTNLTASESHDAGRWPTNVVMTHAATPDGADACADGCVPGCPVAELDAQSGILRAGERPARRAGIGDGYGLRPPRSGTAGVREVLDGGGASRFFPVFRYQAKAPTRERPKVDGVAHPTVKPLALMRWLVRLVTRPGGVVLDLFAGSGTTAEAAIAEGFRCILAEQYQPYIPLIRQRLTSAES